MEHNLRQRLKTAALPIHGLGHGPGRVQNDENILLFRIGRCFGPGGDVLCIRPGKEEEAALLGILEQTLKSFMMIKAVIRQKPGVSKMTIGHAPRVDGLARFLGVQEDDELRITGKGLDALAITGDLGLAAVQAKSSRHAAFLSFARGPGSWGAGHYTQPHSIL